MSPHVALEEKGLLVGRPLGEGKEVNEKYRMCSKSSGFGSPETVFPRIIVFILRCNEVGTC